MDDIRPGETLHTDEGADADARAADLRFVTRGVSHEEAAAVTAVVLASLEEGTGEASDPEPARDPWVRSGRALRSGIEVGSGAWSRSVR
ncbi:MAG TPA: acyl-CoA carboxylase epsilon subunit [Agromyces sp.]|nr:acyl-CoA carboxylase epsilon subunit [Agromyces sp.]